PASRSPTACCRVRRMVGHMIPTDEQAEVLRLALAGGHLAVDALAGTGKTTTLRMLGTTKHQARAGNGIYVAFNRRVVDDAGRAFPPTVKCATAHGLAMRAVGRQFAHKLNRRRAKSADIARFADIHALYLHTPFGSKRLAPGFLAGILMRSINRFCQT